MSDTFESRTNDLMREVYDTLHDTTKVDAIMSLTFDAPPTDDAPTEAFHLDVVSTTEAGKIKRYDANNISSAPQRNLELLSGVIAYLVTNDGNAERIASARRMANAIIDAL